MLYQTETEGSAYLLTTLQFRVGSTQVKLYGGLKVTSTEFTFALSDKVNAILPVPTPGDATTAIAEPFGMTGVTLGGFDAEGRIYKDPKGATAVDLVLNAQAKLSNRLTFAGALVFENTSARLALVTLTASPPLTLTDFVTSVLGGTFGWMDDVTSNIAFVSGSMYYLSGTTAFVYPATAGVSFTPGYHIAAQLQLFGKYDFAIELDVEGKAITLTGTVAVLNFDFIVFNNPQLLISTKSGSSYFKISTALTVLGTAFGSIFAEYRTDTKAFEGGVQSGDLGLQFRWTSGDGGFTIIGISGLPQNVIDMAAQFQQFLNSMQGGCEQIVGGWLKDLCQTSLTPALNGKPSKVGGQMSLPLKLTYTISLGGRAMDPQTIPFTALFDIPTSFSDLPAAMWGSVSSSLPTIAQQMLTNPVTYEALAMAAAIKYGAAAGARFICRAFNNAMQSVAEDLAAAAAEFAASDIAATAELAAAIAGLTVVVVVGIIDAFVDWVKNVWDKIVHPNAEKERQDADNARIDAQAQAIAAAMSKVWDQVNALAASQPVSDLKVLIDPAGQYQAKWAANTNLPGLPAGAVVQYQLQLLTGAPGDATGTPWTGTTPRVYPAGQTTDAFPLSGVPNYQNFKWNSSIRGAIGHITFLSPDTDSQLSRAIQSLTGTDLSSATALANQLSADLTRLRGYNTSGVQTQPVFATLDMPTVMTVGQSRVGFNTRIRSK